MPVRPVPSPSEKKESLNAKQRNAMQKPRVHKRGCVLANVQANLVQMQQEAHHIRGRERSQRGPNRRLDNDQLLNLITLAPLHPGPSRVCQRAAYCPHDRDRGFEGTYSLLDTRRLN